MLPDSRADRVTDGQLRPAVFLLPLRFPALNHFQLTDPSIQMTQGKALIFRRAVSIGSEHWQQEESKRTRATTSNPLLFTPTARPRGVNAEPATAVQLPAHASQDNLHLGDALD